MKKLPILLCTVFVLISCSISPKDDFSKAKKENTIIAFQNFLNKHPSSEFTGSAEALIDSLRFFEFQYKNNIDSLYAFKHRYTESRYVQDIDTMIDSLNIVAVAFNNKGLVYFNEKNNDKAIEFYQKAIEINHCNAETYYNMGKAYYQKGIHVEDKGNYDKAIKCFWEAIHINSNYADAYLDMGDAYGNKGAPLAASICFVKAANLGSELAQEFCDFFGIPYESISYDQTIEFCRKALEINPDDVEAYCNLGEAYFGNYDKAIECYQNAIKLDTGCAKAYYLMGLAYNHKKGNHDKVTECFQKAARLEYIPAQEKLKELGCSW